VSSVETLRLQVTGADAEWMETIRRQIGVGVLTPSLREHLIATILPIVRDGRRDLLELASTTMAGRPLALAFQQAVEACSERAECSCDGVEVVVRAFSALVFIACSEEVPESQVDWVLAAVAPSISRLRPPIFAAGSGKSNLAPRFFCYPDLAVTDPCWLHQSLASVARSTDWTNRLPHVPFSVHPRASRLGTTHLRFLAGTAVHFGAERMRSPTAWSALAELLAAHLRAHLGPIVHVDVECDGTFFGPIYDGLWRYQLARLAAEAEAFSGACPQPRAVVDVPPQTSRDPVRLDLYQAAQGQANRAFMLHPRPGESALTTLDRIASPLRAAGIQDVALLKRGRRQSARQHTAMALPL
jgi:hypothetical protein